MSRDSTKKQERNGQCQRSLTYGKTYNYLSELKVRNKQKYNYINKYGFWKFQEESSELRQKASEIYFTIKETKGLTFSEFWRMYLQKEYTTPNSFMGSLKETAFIILEKDMKFSTFQKMQKIVLSYEKYKEIKCKNQT